MKSARILAIANQKGGVGKTTTAVAEAAALADTGQRVLLVDCDPQGGATFACGYDPANVDGTLYDVLRVIPTSALSPDIPSVTIALDGFDLVPATIDLSNAELELQAVIRREYVLQRALEPVLDRYDWILLDCPPSVSLLTMNALTAAHAVLIPVTPQALAVRGLGLLLNTIGMVRSQRLNPTLRVAGVLITACDKRLVHHQEQAAAIQALCAAKRLPLLGTVPATVRAQEAAGAGIALTRYPGADGAKLAYDTLAQYLLQEVAGA